MDTVATALEIGAWVMLWTGAAIATVVGLWKLCQPVEPEDNYQSEQVRENEYRA